VYELLEMNFSGKQVCKRLWQCSR